MPSLKINTLRLIDHKESEKELVREEDQNFIILNLLETLFLFFNEENMYLKNDPKMNLT